MSFMKPRLVNSPTRQSGISAGEWLQARKRESESASEGKRQSSKKYAFLDDSSSDESFSASNFIKKSSLNETAFQNKQKLSSDRPKTSRGTPEKRTSLQNLPRSDALSRFSHLEKKILSRQSNVNVMSSSDLDLDISSDSEVIRQVKVMKSGEKENMPAEVVKHDSPVNTQAYEPTATKLENFRAEEKRKEFAKKKSVSFATELVREKSLTESEVSLDDFLPNQDSNDDVSLDDVLPSTKLNSVLSFEDLEPAKQVQETANLNWNTFGLHSVDELLPPHNNDDEVPAEEANSLDSDGNLFNIHSIEELVNDDSEATLYSEKNLKGGGVTFEKKERPTQGANFVEEVNDRDYSEDFDSVDSSDDTLKDTESITQDITEEIETENTISTAESVPTESKLADESLYTETFDSESASSTSSLAPPTARKTLSRVESATQTDPHDVTSALYRDRIFTDSEKTFYKPSQVINNEALAVLSSYSPAVLAVQDMLKQQLAFTRDFVARSERLHEAAADVLIADYQYSSLEEARRTIDAERMKMNLPPKYSKT